MASYVKHQRTRFAPRDSAAAAPLVAMLDNLGLSTPPASSPREESDGEPDGPDGEGSRVVENGGGCGEHEESEQEDSRDEGMFELMARYIARDINVGFGQQHQYGEEGADEDNEEPAGHGFFPSLQQHGPEVAEDEEEPARHGFFPSLQQQYEAEVAEAEEESVGQGLPPSLLQQQYEAEVAEAEEESIGQGSPPSLLQCGAEATEDEEESVEQESPLLLQQHLQDTEDYGHEGPARQQDMADNQHEGHGQQEDGQDDGHGEGWGQQQDGENDGQDDGHGEGWDQEQVGENDGHDEGRGQQQNGEDNGHEGGGRQPQFQFHLQPDLQPDFQPHLQQQSGQPQHWGQHQDQQQHHHHDDDHDDEDHHHHQQEAQPLPEFQYHAHPQPAHQQEYQPLTEFQYHAHPQPDHHQEYQPLPESQYDPHPQLHAQPQPQTQQGGRETWPQYETLPQLYPANQAGEAAGGGMARAGQQPCAACRPLFDQQTSWLRQGLAAADEWAKGNSGEGIAMLAGEKNEAAVYEDFDMMDWEYVGSCMIEETLYSGGGDPMDIDQWW